ncbi:MAG TPA: flagellar hook-length control protein FliK [Syntrophomonas sp.]|nr:flagellar hook-length control protein FliK [Syntrophomonas sp.]
MQALSVELITGGQRKAAAAGKEGTTVGSKGHSQGDKKFAEIFGQLASASTVQDQGKMPGDKNASAKIIDFQSSSTAAGSAADTAVGQTDANAAVALELTGAVAPQVLILSILDGLGGWGNGVTGAAFGDAADSGDQTVMLMGAGLPSLNGGGENQSVFGGVDGAITGNGQNSTGAVEFLSEVLNRGLMPAGADGSEPVMPEKNNAGLSMTTVGAALTGSQTAVGVPVDQIGWQPPEINRTVAGTGIPVNGAALMQAHAGSIVEEINPVPPTVGISGSTTRSEGQSVLPTAAPVALTGDMSETGLDSQKTIQTYRAAASISAESAKSVSDSSGLNSQIESIRSNLGSNRLNQPVEAGKSETPASIRDIIFPTGNSSAADSFAGTGTASAIIGDSRTAPTAEAGKPFTAPSAIDYIAARIAGQVKNGVNSLEISLKPEYLGKLKLQLLSHEGSLSVNIVAHTGETLNLINANLHYIKDSLDQQGIKLTDMNVNLANQERQDSQAGNGYREEGRTGNWQSKSQESFENTPHWEQKSSSNHNLLNILA